MKRVHMSDIVAWLLGKSAKSGDTIACLIANIHALYSQIAVYLNESNNIFKYESVQNKQYRFYWVF